MKQAILTGLVFGWLFLGSAAWADVHFDLSPHLDNGRIGLNGVTHAALINPWTGVDTSPTAYNYYQPNTRVFGFELGEDPLFPTATNDPGINREGGVYQLQTGEATSLSGTGLPLGSTLSFTVRSDLLVWNGNGFSPVSMGEYLTLSYGQDRTAGTGTGVLQPLAIKTFTTADTVHIHMDAQLYDNLGGDNPTPGIYMLSAMLQSSNPAVGNSDTFWLVYNFADTETNHAAAMDWINVQLVPEPGSLVLLSLGGLAFLRRRSTNS